MENIEIYIKVTDERDYFILSPSKKEKKYMKLKWTILVLLNIYFSLIEGIEDYRVSGLSCPEAKAYLTVIFHSFLHNNNINSDYILGANIYFTPHGNFSSYF